MTTLFRYIGGLHSVVENRIKWFVEEYGPRWLYVMFSGGKDSSAVLAAAVRCCRDVVVAVYNHIVGQTHVLNVEAASRLARLFNLRVRRVVVQGPRHLSLVLAREPPSPPELLYLVVRSYRGGLDYWSAVERWGFPVPAERWGKGVRWCCAEFKEKWWELLPPNGVYRGRLARFNVVGVKATDSVYRRRLWGSGPVRVFDRGGVVGVTLAPLYNLTDEDVWLLLKHYNIHDIVYKQYSVMGQSPNCTLCPLMSTTVLKKTVKVLPTGYLTRVASILARLRDRYPPGTFSATKINTWLKIICGELEERKAPTPCSQQAGSPASQATG